MWPNSLYIPFLSIRHSTWRTFPSSSDMLLMAGMPIVRVAKKYNVGTRVFYAWLHDKKEPERWSRYQQARKVAAETLVGETLEIADGVKHPEDVPKAKLQTQVRQWLASRYDPDTFGDKSGPTVNISLGDMHVQALKDITNKAKQIKED